MTEKFKIFMISDHPLSTSGVGCQSRYLINSLIDTGKYSFRCLGAAIKHENYDTIKVSDDFIIKPVDGFGSKDEIRQILATEKPDAMLIFSDPRFFIHVWEMEDEIHQVCPIVYNHLWDELPYPKFNQVLYESTDEINCINDLTYGFLKDNFPHPERVNFIPHALPKEIFHPIPDEEKKRYRSLLLGPDREDHFIGFWINRNARRKRPNDLLESWKIFIDDLERTHGHKKATLVLHTDPLDKEGPNLIATAEMLGITQNIFFSTERMEFEKINILHNISDFGINVSLAEGFGLGTLESMYVGNPIIATKTGGLTRQVVNVHTGEENGVALEPDASPMVGSQLVPYIYEKIVNNDQTAQAIMKLYEMGPEKRRDLGLKAQKYAHEEFSMERLTTSWDESLTRTINKWRDDSRSLYTPWEMREVRI
jgi:glycosyltransferase involved in cell wall biosynthesis